MKKVGGIGSSLSGLTGLSAMGIGGAAAAWTPASPTTDGGVTPHTGIVPGLTGVYQDSGETTPITADGDPVGAMNNTEMGVGTDAYSVIQATSANKPTYRTGVNGLDSQPVLSFDGGDSLQGTFGGGIISQPSTILFVGQLDAAVVNNNVVNTFCDGLTVGRRHAALKHSTGTPDDWRFIAGATLVGSAADGNWNIFSIHFNGASGNVWLNGNLNTSGNVGTHDLAGLTMGAAYTGGNLLTGKIAYFLLYNHLLSNADLNQIGNYLITHFPSLSYTPIV